MRFDTKLIRGHVGQIDEPATRNAAAMDRGRTGGAVRLALAMCFWCAATAFAQSGDRQPAGNDSNAVGAIVGTWRGHSTCAITASACHDEINVYRITRIAGVPSRVSVMGSKIVSGDTVVMGTEDWKYDARNHALESLDGRFRLIMSGNQLQGALTVNGTVFRRIYLEREH